MGSNKGSFPSTRRRTGSLGWTLTSSPCPDACVHNDTPGCVPSTNSGVPPVGMDGGHKQGIPTPLTPVKLLLIVCAISEIGTLKTEM